MKSPFLMAFAENIQVNKVMSIHFLKEEISTSYNKTLSNAATFIPTVELSQLIESF